MSDLVAFTNLSSPRVPSVKRIKIDPGLMSSLKRCSGGPAIIVSRGAAELPDRSAGILRTEDVIATLDGDWANALLLLLPDEAAAAVSHESGDAQFLARARSWIQPRLHQLAADVIEAVRKAGVVGEMHERSNGRWVNHPVNSFTLKLQPRKGDIQFTIYGEPHSYDVDGFLKRDQNSYSRGWIGNAQDAQKFAALARLAYDRKA